MRKSIQPMSHVGVCGSIRVFQPLTTALRLIT